MKQRKHYSAADKVMMLREHLENGVRLSDLSEKYNVHPNVLRLWKKALFEGALETFSGKHKKQNGKNAREQKLQDKISKMHEVITEISTENLELKKKYFGAI